MTEEIKSFENQSLYDPTRKTVGAIYRDAKLSNSEDRIESGDLTRELETSLVNDLNDAVQEVCKTCQWHGREFYITVHESKDLAMPNMIKRRLVKTVYRPWPEDDTIVFRWNESRSDVRFCWCLPHHSEMDNMLMNHWLFNPQMIHDIRMWKHLQMEHFGFVKVGLGEEWGMNPYWTFDKDRKMEKPKRILVA